MLLQLSRPQPPDRVAELRRARQLRGGPQRSGVQHEQLRLAAGRDVGGRGQGHGCSQGASTRSSSASVGAAAAAWASSAGLNLGSTSWRIAAQAGP